MAVTRILVRGLLSALLLTATSGCTSSTDATGEDFPWEGFWNLSIDVTVATGVCAGEEDAPIEVTEALITEQGGVVTATGIWSSESGSVSLTGVVAGSTITFGGSYAEDGGTTTTLYTLNPSSMSGSEAWSWTGPGGSCPGSQSTVTGVPR
jgi:hypothetical protein